MTEESLFELAIGTPVLERGALLDRKCAGNPELRLRVEALLRAHVQPGEFLQVLPLPNQTQTFAGVRGDSSFERPSAVIAGKYKLLQQIGEGGMGSVWMADQFEPVKRRVAVKLIRAEQGNSSTILARFEAERQAIALMDHPHIAKLLDAGTTDVGSPFFVMELVKGVPLTEFCDAHQLSILERLQLFQQICSAVQHAHQKGIIHRDLKPTNILVESHDDKPVPRVIDFGLAKATSGMQLTEHTLFTALGTVAGTPLYMAPEQAKFNAIDVDTRADIYALGVILYELLTGTTPIERETFRKAAFDEMLRVIREQEPPTPSKRLSSSESKPSVAANRRAEPANLGRFVKGELDWIVMKALAKERDRRYETATGFAKDIERFLNHEPVQAGPPRVSYRLRKFVQRHRPQVVAAGLVLLAIMAGMAGTTLALLRAWQADGVAKQRYEEAEAARVKAAAATAAEAQERKKAELAEMQTLADFRASTGDAIEQLIGSKPELGPLDKIYLEKTLSRWQQYASREGNDQFSRNIRSEGHFNVGVLWQKLGRKEEAWREFLAARDIQASLVEQFPEVPGYQNSLANTRHNLGVLLVDFGKVDQARTEYEAARDMRKKLVLQFPASRAYQQDLAFTHNNLGVLLRDLGHGQEALAEFSAALAFQTKLTGQFPDVPDYQQDLARTHTNLGISLAGLGESEKGQVEFEAARRVEEKLVERFPAVIKYKQSLANSHHSLGVLLADIGKAEESRVEYEAARTIKQELARQFPALPAYQQDLAHTLNDLGGVLVVLGMNEEARAEFQATRGIVAKLADQFPEIPAYRVDLAHNHQSLGSLFTGLGEREKAQAEYEAARDIFQKLVEHFPTVPAYQQHLARAHNSLGIRLAQLGKLTESHEEHLAAVKIQESLVRKYSAVTDYQVELGGSYCNFGNRVSEEGESAESLEWFDRAIRTLTPVHEKFPLDVSARQFLQISYRSRADAYDQLKKHADADKDWDRAIELTSAEERPSLRASRAVSQHRPGIATEAVAEVQGLTKSANWTADQWYDFACVYSVAAGLIVDKQREYGDRAMDLLRQAVKAGYQDSFHLKKDTDLDSLREREDFKKLLAELEQK